MSLKQVFIVNQDLKMGKGKIAVQVAHGEIFYLNKFIDTETINSARDLSMFLDFKEWMQDGLMKKIVLKASQEEMMDIVGTLIILGKIWYYVVYDKGLTQVPENSMTCIVIEPLDEQIADHCFGNLKLL